MGASIPEPLWHHTVVPPIRRASAQSMESVGKSGAFFSFASSPVETGSTAFGMFKKSTCP